MTSYSDATFRDIEVDQQHPWHWNEGFAQDAEITEEDIRIRHMTQYAAVTDIDRHMDRLLKALTATGKADNTLVIYTSDHGLALGQNGFWGKGNATRPLNLYDISIRVPLLISGPDIAAGTESDRCVDHFDTFQTICDGCGIDAEQLRENTAYPGQSYLPIASGHPSPDWNDTRFAEYGDMRMTRTSHCKLVQRYPNGPHELFDLTSDPKERTNLIDNLEYAALQKELANKLDAFFAQHEDPEKSGLRVKHQPRHNTTQKPTQTISSEAWRDGIRESRGLQIA